VRTWLTVAVVLAAAGAAVYFASANATPIAEINLYFARPQNVPVWQALLAALLAGAALAALVFSWPIVRLNLGMRRARRRIATLERELHGLRTLPLDGHPAHRDAEPEV
jgi:hypothetical protein